MNSKQEYRGASYYKSITGLWITPRELFTRVKPKYKKGELIRRFRLFGHTFSETYAKSDMYESYYTSDLVDAETYAKERNLLIDELGNMFVKAEVKIEKNGYSDEYHHFNTDEEAQMFVNNIIGNCKLCGNELL
jgi:hypothetical protein